MKIIQRTITYLVALFALMVGVFFVGVSETRACTINVLQSGIRVSGYSSIPAVLPEDFFQDDNPPFVYLDLKPQNCGEGDSLYVSVGSLVNPGFLSNFDEIDFAFSEEIENFHLNSSQLQQEGGVTVVMRAGEDPCDITNDSDDNNVECLLFFIVSTLPLNNPDTEIVLLVGDMIENLNPEVPEGTQEFAEVFGGNSPSFGSCDELNAGGYYYIIADEVPAVDIDDINYCNFFVKNPFSSDIFSGDFSEKFFDYYASLGSQYQYTQAEWGVTIEGVPYLPNVAAAAFPALRYQCDTTCDEDFYIPANPYLEYGGWHINDEGAVNLDPLPETYNPIYEPLAPLPFEGLSGGETPTLGNYLAGLFRALIVITVVLSVIMIVISGITYMVSKAAKDKQDGKQRIWDALIGLLIALGSWLLLNTINPNLASDLSVSVPVVSVDGYDYSAPGVASIPGGCPLSKHPDALPPICSNCTPIPDSVNLKPEVSQNGNNTIASSMAPKLAQLQEAMQANNIQWRVTEAFGPTYLQHCSLCHYRGTCIDANFTGNTPATPQNIQNFVNAAADAGLRAVYETNNPDTITALQEQTDLEPSTGGVGNYLLLSGITAPHFSVYNQ